MAATLLIGCSNEVALAPTATAPTAETDATRTTTTSSISGTLAVEADFVGNVQAGNHALGRDCITADGYDDLDGAQVVITGPDGTVLGAGDLKAAGLRAPTGSTSMADTWCGFSFIASGIPRGEAFYGVAIAGRDPIQLVGDDAFAPQEFTLGDVPMSD